MVKLWRSLRLHTQLATASAVLLAVTITITAWINTESQRRVLLQDTVRGAVSLAKSFSLISSYLVITNKLDELESLLLQSATFPIITRIRVLTKDGKGLSHVRKGKSGKIEVDFSLKPLSVPKKLKTVNTSINLERKSLVVWHPITTSQIIGWIKLDVSLHDVISLYDKIIFDNVIGAIAAIIIDVLILLAILLTPARSFKKIVSFANNMIDQPGKKMEFSAGSYELTKLLDVLNSSSSKLFEQNNKIKQQTDNLVDLNSKRLLLEKESEQKNILDSMLESVITANEKGIILTFNKAAETLFGYLACEVIGQNVTILMPPTYAHEHDSYIQRYLAGGKARIIGIGREIEGKTKNDQIFPMRISVSELRTNKGREKVFIGTCQDLTELKQKEEQIRRSQKMDALGKLTGGIAHDYNNLLAIILGHAELLKLHMTKGSLSKYVDEINHAAERGAKLTRKLLGFSRLKESDTAVHNINTLLNQQKFMLEKTLSVRISLTLNLAKGLWPVEIDSGDFENVILNMAINSMHAMKNGGQLIIETKNKNINELMSKRLGISPGDYVMLSIRDTGSGMDKKTKERIFDPYYTTKGEYGVGLGLSQVYGFIEQCHGSITVDSTIDEGTIFTLYFPRSNRSLNEAKKQEDNLTPERVTNYTVLVVDDELPLAEVACEILSNHGYQVFIANDAQKALQILKTEHIDLMLSDIIMPGMDGYELASIVHETYPHIKIQLSTGFSDDRERKDVDPEYQKNRIFKPYTSEMLLRRIDQLLNA